jgi:hypothetical protein
VPDSVGLLVLQPRSIPNEVEPPIMEILVASASDSGRPRRAGTGRWKKLQLVGEPGRYSAASPLLAAAISPLPSHRGRVAARHGSR